jgi:hypothetical protein
VCTLAEFRLYCSPVEAGEILDVFEYLTMTPRLYGELEVTVDFRTNIWSIDEGLRFRAQFMCTFTGFRWEDSPLKMAEFSRFLYISQGTQGDMATWSGRLNSGRIYGLLTKNLEVPNVLLYMWTV